MKYVAGSVGVANGTKVDVAVPAGTQDGDLMICSFHSDGSFNGPTWTQQANVITLSAHGELNTRIASSEPASYTFGSSGGTFANARIDVYRLEDKFTPLDVAVTSAYITDPSDVVFPSITSLTDHAWHYVSVVNSGTPTSGPPGYTQRVSALSYDKEISPAGLVTGVRITGGSFGDGAAFCVMMRPYIVALAPTFTLRLYDPTVVGGAAGPHGSGVGAVGATASSTAFKGATGAGVGRAGVGASSTALKGGRGAVAGAAGAAASSTGSQGAAITVVGRAGAAGSAASARKALASTVGAAGVASASTSTRLALSTTIGRVGAAGAAAGVAAINTAATGSGQGAVGAAADAAGAHQALGSAIGAVGISSATTSTRSSTGSAVGRAGLAGSEQGLAASVFGNAVGRAGVGGGALGIAGVARLEDTSGGRLRELHGDTVTTRPPRKVQRAVGVLVGTVGVAGYARGLARIVPTKLPRALTPEEQRVLTKALRKSIKVKPRAAQVIAGSIAGAAGVGGSARGKAQLTLVEPPAPAPPQPAPPPAPEVPPAPALAPAREEPVAILARASGSGAGSVGAAGYARGKAYWELPAPEDDEMGLILAMALALEDYEEEAA